MRILVTGGAGFIGSNFVRYLIEETDDRIVTLDAITYAGSKSNLQGVLNHFRHDFVEGDIRNRELVGELVSEVDAIVNFAAQSHVDRSIEASESFVSTNVQGTRTLLDAALAADIERFVQISTDEVYGEIVDGVASESAPLDPRNPYAATKAGADLLARSYYVTHGLPVLCTRSSNNYGPRQNAEKLVPKLITRAARGESLPLYGDGTHVREWTYVRDNCRAIDLVLREGEPGEIYNIGSGVQKQNIEVARAIAELVGADDELITFVEDRPGHDRRYAIETEKIESLGWRPQWSFDAGLEKTVEYYLH